MGKLAEALRRHFPRHGRRRWRYVSPRRHGVGLVVLALVLAAAWAYWALTNDGRIRQQAEQQLGKLTGSRVNISSARFRLFGPIELHDVRIYVPWAQSRHPFFQSDTVLLRHDPWSLLLRGELRAKEVICVEPMVTFEVDESGEDQSQQKLVSMVAKSRKKGLSLGDRPLPEIRLRRGKWQKVSIGGIRSFARMPPAVDVAQRPLNLSMIPRGREKYVIRFEERQAGRQAESHGQVELNLNTGEFRVLSGYLPSLPRLQPVLPAEYSKWLAKYKIKGALRITGQSGSDGPANGEFRVKLEGLMLTLPPEEGGLKLADVRGEILFKAGKIKLENVRGQLPSAPKTLVRLSGEYKGYEPTSDFVIEMVAEHMKFPSDLQATGQLGNALAWLQQEYNPQGNVDVTMRYVRIAPVAAGGGGGAATKKTVAGIPTYTGTAKLKLDKALYKHFRVPLTNVTGTIDFTPETAMLRDLQGRHGSGEYTITGRVWVKQPQRYDILVVAKNAPLDEYLRKALTTHMGRTWETVNPTGTAGMARVHVTQQGRDTPRKVVVKLELTGTTDMRYKHFPYPLEDLRGELRIADDTVEIHRLTGRHGPLECKINNGRIDGLRSGKPEVDVRIEASNLPLDKTLEAALSDRGREVFRSLRARGRVHRVLAKLTQPRGKRLTYDIQTWFEGVSFAHESFPYDVTEATTGAKGSLTITPAGVELRRIHGRHGRARVTITAGSLPLADKTKGMTLNVDAKGVPVDQALYQALPPRAQRAWRALSPGGLADMTLTLKGSPRGQAEKLDYVIDVRATDMQIVPATFPYPFRGIAGNVIITPGGAEIPELTSAVGSMEATVQGQIAPRADGDWAELVVTARNLPVDRALLKALPDELAPLVKRIKPGGTCTVDLKRLGFLYRPAEVAAAAATKPAEAEKPWVVKGRVLLSGASADLGSGHNRIGGTIDGSAERTSAGLRIDAEIALNSVVVGSRKITGLTGRITKKPPSTLIHLEDLVARLHGGRMSGFARLDIGKEMRYGVNVCIENARLAHLFKSSAKTKPPAREMTGTLTGDMKMVGTVDRPATRRGAGFFRISDAKLYKLPILLGALQVIFLSLPGDSAFTDGEVRYEIRGQKLIFREIYLTGPGLSLLGSGSMDLKTDKMRLTFLTAPPGRLGRMTHLRSKVNLAEELLRVFVRKLVEFEVTGTPDKPKMRTIPLGNIKDVIGKLLNPERRTE